MGARGKLNEAFLLGSALLAGVVGTLVESWLVFFVALGVLLGLNLYVGDIRLKRRK